MKKLLLFVSVLFLQTGTAQGLFVKTFGNPKDKAIVFLHGGPGYNSSTFEGTTAKPLADKGFFVIVYDRRGEGRSTDAAATFDFAQTLEDLDALYSRFGLKKATLIGHSFGGMVGTKFTEAHPEKVNALILVGAPVNLQESFDHIISKSRKIYTEKNDSANLNYLGTLEKMDKTTMLYAAYCFMHAMNNGFYTPKNPSEESKNLKSDFQNFADFAWSSKMTQEPPMGFWKNDRYTTIDLSENLRNLISTKVRVYGLYGKEDGLY